MALSLGLGLSLSNSNHIASSAIPSPQQTLCNAIKKRQYILATIKGEKLLLEPYVVYSCGGKIAVNAIVIVSDKKPIRRWSPKRFLVTRFDSVEIVDDTFIPSAAFKFEGEAICVVDAIQSVDDALEAVASA